MARLGVTITSATFSSSCVKPGAANPGEHLTRQSRDLAGPVSGRREFWDQWVVQAATPTVRASGACEAGI